MEFVFGRLRRLRAKTISPPTTYVLQLHDNFVLTAVHKRYVANYLCRPVEENTTDFITACLVQIEYNTTVVEVTERRVDTTVVEKLLNSLSTTVVARGAEKKSAECATAADFQLSSNVLSRPSGSFASERESCLINEVRDSVPNNETRTCRFKISNATNETSYSMFSHGRPFELTHFPQQWKNSKTSSLKYAAHFSRDKLITSFVNICNNNLCIRFLFCVFFPRFSVFESYFKTCRSFF